MDNSGNEIEVEETSETLSNEAPSMKPSPKKRGRKRKCEQWVSNVSPETPASNQRESISTRSGRKKKSVNYFALANPDLEEQPQTEETDKLKVKRTSKRTSVNNKVSVKKESIEIEDKKNSSVCSNEILVQEAASNTSNEINIVLMDDSVKEEGQSILNESHSEILDENSEVETQIKKEKVYRKTGSTVRMMNILLSQADLKKNIADSERIISRPIKRGRPCKAKKTVDNVNSNYEDDPSDKTTVTCAICNKEVEKNGWIHHKQRYHNNLAWRVGEPALDLNDMDLVKQILNAIYVTRKPFYCENCDKSIKSVNGYLSHKSVCGKVGIEDVRVACEYCFKRMLPISLPSHIRNTHEKNERVEKVPKRNPSAIGGKRKAAEKALEVIHNFSSDVNSIYRHHFEELPFLTSKESISMLESQMNTTGRIECKYPECKFECFTAKDIKNHLKFCMLKPEDAYVCKHCLDVQLNIADMMKHIESAHNIVIGSNGESEEETKSNNHTKKDKQNNSSEKEKQPPKMRSEWPPFLLPSDRRVDVIFAKAYEWTLKFCEDNYKSDIPEDLFPCLKADWDYMDLDLAEDYLPKMPYSCDVGFETVAGFQSVLHKDHTFRKFEMFESYLENNGNSTIFCGGPITALSWMPTPHENNDIHQIVAVATKPHPDAQYETDVNYNEKCFLQFWDVGPLKNTDTSLFRPKQAFCLQFDHGPIWDLQWCPSSCYDLSDQPEDSEKLRRMGVIAVAGSDSFIYIYSIPYFKESGQFYNARPVLKLIRNVIEEDKMGNMDYYATRMSWTKASGHKYLAVGYSDGQVAIYNLWCDSKLLRYKTSDNTDVLMPYTVFDAHHHTITAIALHHSHDGCGWLMTGSYDRTVRTWNLENNYPVRTIKGNIVNDAVWMTNWMCHIIGYDEASTIGNACSVIHQCKEGTSDPLYLFHCSSAITSLSSSDWLNGIIQANAVGEIFATFPKQLMMCLNWKNLKNKKLLFGYTTLIEKDKTVEERLKVNSEKQKALRNQLKVKTKIKTEELPADREVMHLDYNPHYYEYEPLVYHEMDDKYGLIFCDHKMKSWSEFPEKLQKSMSHASEEYCPSRPNLYPLQSITKIQFNMNRQASVYYVSGYQAGFIRVTYMKFLASDPYVRADSERMKN